MKILYAGTPEFSIQPLKAILSSGFEVVGVVTQIDKPQGRKAILTPPALKVFATENDIPVYQFAKIRDCVDELKSIGADIMITCAYGQILTQEVLDCFSLGIFNIHASLLPKYRGASPIQCSILNGETTTGITVMKTERGLDTGDILLQKSLSIGEYENCGELCQRLSFLGGEAIVEALSLLSSGKAEFTVQDNNQATVVKKIDKKHAQINFEKSPEEVNNLVRANNPLPIAFAVCDNIEYNIFAVEKLEQGEYGIADCGTVVNADTKRGLIIQACGGLIKILEIQQSGGKRLNCKDFCCGRKLTVGQRFTYKE